MRALLCAATVLGLVWIACGQDSLNVSCVSRYLLWDGMYDVAVTDGYAFVATGSTGLQVFDVSNATQPEVVFSLSPGGYMQRIIADGGYAYVTDPDGGLRVVDISIPLAPQQVGSYLSLATQGGIWGLAKTGNLVAFFYTWPHRLAVINVANPAAPTLYCDVAVPDFAGGLAARDSLIFYCDYQRQSLCILDVRNPAAPVELGCAAGLGYSGAADIVLQGNYAYVATEQSGLYVVDVSNPAAPSLAAQVPLSGWHRDLAVSPSYLLVLGGSLVVMDLSNPAQPVVVGSWANDCGLTGLASGACTLQDQTAYVLVNWRCQQFVALDLTNPTQPQTLGTYDRSPAYHVTDVAAFGDHLCLSFEWHGTGTGGLLVMDATNPSALAPVSWRATDPAYAIGMRGNWAYICAAYFDRRLDDPGEFVAYNLTDPADPVEQPWLEVPVAPMRIAFGDRCAYVGCADQYDNGLAVVDLQNPAAPNLISYRSWPYYNPDLAATDSLLLAATHIGLKIFQTTDPLEPVEISVALPGQSLRSVAADDQYAYASGWDNSFYVVNITNPSDPVLLAAVTGPSAENLLATGNRVYAACDSAGVYVWDVSMPTVPQPIGYYDTPSRACGVAVRDSLIFVADDRNIGVYRWGLPAAVEPRAEPTVPDRLALSVHPNPFNAAATIRYELFTAGEVELQIFDVTGREAASPLRGRMAAGSYTFRLDGSQMGSGIYFVSLHAGGQSVTQKAVLLK